MSDRLEGLILKRHSYRVGGEQGTRVMHAAIYYRENPYEAHGWGHGETPEEAEAEARIRWPAPVEKGQQP